MKKLSSHLSEFLTLEDRRIESVGIKRLSRELMELYKNLSLRKDEIKYRDTCLEIISTNIKSELSDFNLIILKSYTYNFYHESINFMLTYKDIRNMSCDLPKKESDAENRNIFMSIKTILLKLNILDPNSIIFADKYDKPFIKCEDTTHIFKFRFYLELEHTVEQDNFLFDKLKNNLDLRIMYALLKYLMKTRNLDSNIYGLKSYYLFLMTYNFYILHPLTKFLAESRNIGQLLMDFFQFYGVVFNYKYTTIRFHRIYYEENKSEKLSISIIDPVSRNKIGDDCKIIHLVRLTFMHCFKIMNLAFHSHVKSHKVLKILWFPLDEDSENVRNDNFKKISTLTVENPSNRIQRSKNK